MSIPFDDFFSMVATVATIQASKRVWLAGIVIWAYDLLLTFDEEVLLLWTRNPRGGGIMIKCLYLINRYLPFMAVPPFLLGINPEKGVLSVSSCRVQFLVMNLYQVTAVIVATTIFTFRLYTIYYEHKYIRLFLVLLAIASHTSILILAIIILRTNWISMSYSELLGLCHGSLSPAVGGVIVTPIALESAIAFLTMYHAWLSRNQKVALEQLQDISVTTKVMGTLYADGLAYYVIVLSIRLMTCFIYWLSPANSIVVANFESFLTSTITSRWFLSFRRVLVDSLTPNPSNSHTLTDITWTITTLGRDDHSGAENIGMSRRRGRYADEEGQVIGERK